MARQSLKESVDHKQLEPTLVTPQKAELPPLRFKKRKKPEPDACMPQQGDVLYTASPALCKKRKIQMQAADRLREYIDSGLITDEETAHRAVVLFNKWTESTLHKRAGSVNCTDSVYGMLWNHKLSWLGDTLFRHITSGTTDMTRTVFPRRSRKWY